jgi:hypothetical protein
LQRDFGPDISAIFRGSLKSAPNATLLLGILHPFTDKNQLKEQILSEHKRR